MGRVGFTIAVAMMVALCACAESARGQCEYGWKPGDGVPGIVGTISTMIEWDPDGVGPNPSVLVVGGGITIAGESFANSLALWNGSNWIPFGGGTNGSVFALAIYKGELIAGGSFTVAGGATNRYLARWDGENWQEIGGGLNQAAAALFVDGDDLYVGGSFTTAGGVPANRIARWNGISWSPLGTGMNNSVWTICKYNGAIHAGGQFTLASGSPANRIARWDGENWLPLGSGANGSVTAILAHGSSLYASGYVSNFGGAPGTFGVARWNGQTWAPLNNGIPSFGSPEVYGMSVYNNEIIVGGSFSFTFGGVTSNRIARWNGTNWLPLGTGVVGTHTADFSSFRGNLIVSGSFSAATGVPVSNVASWNGSNWGRLGNGNAGAQARLWKKNNELFVSGSVSLLGGVEVNCIGRWNGANWHSFGTNSSTRFTIVGDMEEYQGQVTVCGNLVQANGTSMPCVARWNEQDWIPLGGAVVDSFGPLMSDLINYDGELYLAGRFSSIGGVTAFGIARWNGTEWRSVGEGIFGFNGARSLTVFGSDLIVGGVFASAGGVSANGIARWNGMTWQPMGNGLSGAGTSFPTVTATAVYRGNLYAGGRFDRSGVGIHPIINNVAMWNGTNWQALGVGVDNSVYKLTEYADKLFVGGAFTSAGGLAASYVAQWNGSSWNAMDSGLGPSLAWPSDALEFGGDLIVVAANTTAGQYLSNGRATWGPIDPKPVIAQQPAVPSVCAGSAVSLRTVATGDGALSFRWRKSGVELVDGGEMMGTQTNTLVFVHAGVADAGEYDCVVKLNDCTQATSNSVMLTVYPTNTADGNGDGVVDGRDVQGMVDALVGFAPVSAALCAYELNSDGIVSEADVGAFVERVLVD